MQEHRCEVMRSDPLSIPDFELVRPVGRGSYGEVWLARSVTGIHRAIKVVYRDRFEEARPFEREFAGIKRFEPISRSQENLVDILHVGRKDEGGCFYYVMELADPASGDPAPVSEASSTAWEQDYRPRTLRETLATRKRLPVEECLSIAIGLTRAVKHLHEHGLIHRDIKPSNVIFVNGTPKLADIGLVSAVEESRSFVGTEGFVPPEGPGKPAADLYSLGKVLYEMSTGRDRLDFPKLPEALEKIPKREALLEFNEVVLKACHLQVKERYASATDLLDDLLLLQAGRSVKRLRLAERRLARLIPLGLTFVGLVLVVLVVQHLRTREAQELARVESRYRHEAEAQELATRQLLYASDMNLAHQAYAAGDLGRTKSLLTGCLPKPGAPDFRGFEWRYYWGLCRGDQDYTFPIQSNAVAELAFSPDGRLLASAGYDHRVQMWDFKDRQLVKTYATSGGVEDVGFSPDGREILMADTAGCVEVKEVESGRVLFHLQGAFRRATISPGGPLLALGGGGKQASAIQGPVEVWDYRANQRLFSLTNAGTYVAFSPDGRRLATGSNNHELKIWNLGDAALWRQFQPVEDNFGMSFSPDGRKLLLGDELGFLSIWDPESGQRLAGIPAHKGNIFKTAISPDGKVIASVGADQTVRLWNAESLSELRILRGHASEVWAVAFSPDSKMLVTGGKDGRILAWNVAQPSSKEILTHDVNFWDWPVFSADGSRVAVGEKKKGVTVWRVADGRLLDTIGDAERPLAFGTHAASLLALGQNGDLQQWTLSLTNHQLLKRVPLPDMEVRAHAFLPERNLLITGDRQGNIRMWDSNSGAELSHWQAHPDRITSIALSPDHTLLATAAESDDDAKIWNLGRHELVRTLRGHKMTVFGVAFSPDGQTIATASVDDTCCLWGVRTGQRLAELGGHQGGTYSVAFSPDGKTLAVGCNEGELKLWNLATRRDMMTLAAEPHTIFAVSFSPDGSTLATVSFNHHNEECSLKLWRALDMPGVKSGFP